MNTSHKRMYNSEMLTVIYRYCPKCETNKPQDQFVKNRGTKSGYGSYCRPCHNEIGQANRAANGGSRRYHLKRRYGVDDEFVDALIEKQGGKCAICNEREPTNLDHDHATGKVRGVLCVPCNNGLGCFSDIPERIEFAAKYLRWNVSHQT